MLHIGKRLPLSRWLQGSRNGDDGILVWGEFWIREGIGLFATGFPIQD
jgi:hypothetical protein